MPAPAVRLFDPTDPPRCRCCKRVLRNDVYGSRCEDCWSEAQPYILRPGASVRAYVAWTPEPDSRPAREAAAR